MFVPITFSKRSSYLRSLAEDELVWVTARDLINKINRKIFMVIKKTLLRLKQMGFPF